MIRETIVALIVYAGALVASAQAQQPPPPAYYYPAPYYYVPAQPAVVYVPSWTTGPLGMFWWRTWTPIPQVQQPLPPPPQLPPPSPPQQ